ncbi:cytochrome P450 [Paractinoplanes hotanensis]|uniref:Cytochrome P450 n=1 Tax=Paractinoplanes hotanensis TaxID=2906497 RepID=A0ABT0Y0D6_9ACTN|nr:cytochrome P450 [Actinoplanes hotanensis]MCM4078948.1 cytochrome P450 [Actinoplanes hotanensis]
MSGGSARGRDRRVYLRSHPVLFALLEATRRWPALRLGGTVLVHEREAFRAALTRVPLDRTAAGTTGGAAGELGGAGALFDQQGDEHRDARRETAALLGAAGIARLRPVWAKLLDDRLPVLGAGGTVDLVPLTAEIAGATAAALLELDVDPVRLADVARSSAAAAARAHLSGLGGRRAQSSASRTADQLLDLVAPHGSGADSESGAALNSDAATNSDAGSGSGSDAGSDAGSNAGSVEAAVGCARDSAGRPADAGLNAMLAVAAINTTVAALPRAAAWVCDDRLWEHAESPVLVDELFRVVAPTPLLPRVVAADAEVGGCPVKPGDRLLLIARHAADAHRRDPSVDDPAPARTAQLVFGVGPHACPGAGLARAQLADLLAALAPYRPVVVRARADRRAALPGWRSLIVRGTT